MIEKNKLPSGSEQEAWKKKAALSAVEMVTSGMVLGLGTGSTVRFALEELGRRIKEGTLHHIRGIPSSLQTQKLAQEFGIPLATFEDHQDIDLTIDGADEVDPHLDLIKGGGGALLREKILAQASRRHVIIIDESKLSPRLGTRFPVPVEVIPFAWPLESKYLRSLGAKVVLRKNKDGRPFTTDQNNFILCCHFGPLSKPEELVRQLSERAAIIENGLFLGMATEVHVAGREGLRRLKREKP